MFSSKNFSSYRCSSSPPPVPHLHAPLLGIIIRGNSELGKEKRNNTPCLLRVLANSPSWAWTTFPSFSQLIATCSSDASSKLHPQKSSSSSLPPLPPNVDEGSFIIISCYFFFPMYLFIFDCAGSLLLRGFFSSCDEWSYPLVAVCRLLIAGACCGSCIIRHAGFSSCSSQAVEHRHHSYGAQT